MKKFKTRRSNNLVYVIIVILIICFFLLSFIKLNKSYSNLVNILTKEFNNNENKPFILTNNLDYLINSYSFKENNNPYHNGNNST